MGFYRAIGRTALSFQDELESSARGARGTVGLTICNRIFVGVRVIKFGLANGFRITIELAFFALAATYNPLK